MSDPVSLFKAGLKARKAFRVWRERRRKKKAVDKILEEQGNQPATKPKGGDPMLKGKLTYTAVLVGVAPILAQWVGFDVFPEDLIPFVQAGAAALALYGRWRATR